MRRLGIDPGTHAGAHPERRDRRPAALDRWIRRAAGPVLRRLRTRQVQPHGLIRAVGEEEARLRELDDQELRYEAFALGTPLCELGFRDDRIARAFALVREAAHRTIGERHHDVQLVGGRVLLAGLVAEMETGEGKTLTATLAVTTAALRGIPVEPGAARLRRAAVRAHRRDVQEEPGAPQGARRGGDDEDPRLLRANRVPAGLKCKMRMR